MFVVVVTEKGGGQQKLTFEDGPIFIGRVHGNEVVLPRGNVSKRHAKIERLGKKFVLTDMGSTNGTYVNGRRILSSQDVGFRDKMYIGDFILHVEQPKKQSSRVPKPVKGSEKAKVVTESSIKAPRESKILGPSPSPQKRVPDQPSETHLPLPKPGAVSVQGSEEKPIVVAPNGPTAEPRGRSVPPGVPPRPSSTIAAASTPPLPPSTPPLPASKPPLPGSTPPVPPSTPPVPSSTPPVPPSTPPVPPSAPSAPPVPSSSTLVPPSVKPPRTSEKEPNAKKKGASSPGAPVKYSESMQQAPSGPFPAPDTTPQELLRLSEIMLESLSKEIKQVDRSNGPARINAETAVSVRSAVHRIVQEAKENGTVKPTIDAEQLKGKVYRGAVDLGPLTNWIEDAEVERILVRGANLISLFRNGKWTDAQDGFADQAEFFRTTGCLKAGLKANTAGDASISRYYLEEGFSVYAALTRAVLTNPLLYIDKTVKQETARTRSDVFSFEGVSVLADAIETDAKIAVVGSSCAVRNAVYFHILSMLPGDKSLLSFEDFPSSILRCSNCSRIFWGLFVGKQGEEFQSLLFHAVSLETDWFGISGTDWSQISTVMSAAANRLAVVAELPLGGFGELNRELSIVMTGAGYPLSPLHAAAFLDEAFDLIVVAGRSETGAVIVDKIVSTGLSDNGTWMPRILYQK